jgi:hypothetical protein
MDVMTLRHLYRRWKRDRITPKKAPVTLSRSTQRNLIRLHIWAASNPGKLR